MSEIANELGEVVAALDVVATNGCKASVQGYKTLPTPGAAARIRAADYASLISQRDALRAELDELLSGLREACDKVPQLPIEAATQDAATEALAGFCYLLGAHESRYTARQAAGEVVG